MRICETATRSSNSSSKPMKDGCAFRLRVVVGGIYMDCATRQPGSHEARTPISPGQGANYWLLLSHTAPQRYLVRRSRIIILFQFNGICPHFSQAALGWAVRWCMVLGSERIVHTRTFCSRCGLARKRQLDLLLVLLRFPEFCSEAAIMLLAPVLVCACWVDRRAKRAEGRAKGPKGSQAAGQAGG